MSVCPMSTCKDQPVVISQILAVLSQLAETIRLPPQLNAAEVAKSACPRAPRNMPLAESQNRTVLSLLAVNTCTPSGLKDAELTPNEWPSGTRKHTPVTTSQNLAVLSAIAKTTFFLSSFHESCFLALFSYVSHCLVYCATPCYFEKFPILINVEESI